METAFLILSALVVLFIGCCGAAIVIAEFEKRRLARETREHQERVAKSRQPLGACKEES